MLKNKLYLNFITSYLGTSLYIKSTVLSVAITLEEAKLNSEKELELEVYYANLNKEILENKDITGIVSEVVEEVGVAVTVDTINLENQEQKLNEEREKIVNEVNLKYIEKLENIKNRLNNLSINQLLNLYRLSVSLPKIKYMLKKLVKVTNSKLNLENCLKTVQVNLNSLSALELFLNKKAQLPQFYLSQILLNIFKKKKVSLRKKYKKRWLKRTKFKKLKKIRFFRHLRKWWLRKHKFKKLSQFRTRNFFYTKKFADIPTQILIKKVPLTNLAINDSALEYNYKLNKKNKRNKTVLKKHNLKKKLVLYMRNYHQKPYWKLRQARRTHWNLFFNKSIRSQRYKQFINTYLKKYYKSSYERIHLINLFTKLQISWKRLQSTPDIYKSNLIECFKQPIILLPLFHVNFFQWKSLKKRNFKLRKKIGKWSFLNFKKSVFPWLQKRKNFPKQIHHIQPNIKLLKYTSQFDIMTSSLCLLKPLDSIMLDIINHCKTNSLIKLHMYRYKAN